MAPKKSSIVLNVEQFIHDVEERPAIWNRNYHCNKAFLEQMWEELSAAHKLPKVVLKAKWKGLRDNFRVEYKRIPRAENGEFLLDPATFESKWIHYYALLFLTEHMRHRMPKNEQDGFYYPQQSQECEKTIVEPDLTNGLIRIPDSDEEFDEDDVDDDDDEGSTETPPAAHAQPPLHSSSIKIEESSVTRSLLRPLKDLQKQSAEKQAAEDLSKKSAAAIPSQQTTNQMLSNNNNNNNNNTINSCGSSNSINSVSNLVQFNNSAAQQHKKRSVSPPPLYNKAHHVASTAFTASALSKDRDDYSHQMLNGSSSLHGSHEHLNFTKHSYANGIIPALKLKRPRLSEDSNFNGSSTMDNTSSQVPEDDDFHYLLSLHPYMKQLNAAQKLRIRTKIQKLIFKELYKEDLEETK